MDKWEKLLIQIIKFVFVGGTAFLIDFGILYVLTEYCGINYLISGTISFSISVIWNYVLSVKWVFDAKEDNDKAKEMTTFIGLSLIGLGINQFFMWLSVDKLGVYYMTAKIIVTFIVMIYNFVSRKIIIEGKQ